MIKNKKRVKKHTHFWLPMSGFNGGCRWAVETVYCAICLKEKEI